MNATSAAVAGAVTFVWLGMVLGISFLEAPLKFRAPGVTIPVGLGIGRLVFRALNAVETVLAVVVAAAVALGGAPVRVGVLTAAVAALLVTQLAVVRPRLNRRSDRVLAGEELPRSRSHLWYVALEVLKAGTLIALGACLLTA
ncbi:membrane protein [Streptomyces sp. PBH53]|uniref:Transmembrane protein n=2 Tax=Streptomyces TaxID=1883 RepID=A0ABS9JHT7_9ACTN|nr:MULTISPECIES: hypothetical protein [Streptomyces]AKN74106.1 membrane protein [Streptomyces sp. PBH53]MCG0065126.1 hypothetical protein [Streptomyces tricolor]BCM65588.1 hypothetical protein EASAB2608_00922 [Streptomyces sp. EAS-AB2608]